MFACATLALEPCAPPNIDFFRGSKGIAPPPPSLGAYKPYPYNPGIAIAIPDASGCEVGCEAVFGTTAGAILGMTIRDCSPHSGLQDAPGLMSFAALPAWQCPRIRRMRAFWHPLVYGCEAVSPQPPGQLLGSKALDGCEAIAPQPPSLGACKAIDMKDAHLVDAQWMPNGCPLLVRPISPQLLWMPLGIQVFLNT
ncbi:hypothetical protein BC628DRAFT_1339285 [Trametes gibbosa]|nr:hypothetical protein BC628DRAFT_1339285 [Trametes gibbosa]